MSFSFIIHISNVILCVLLHSPLWHALQLHISRTVYAASIQKCWDKFPYLQDSTFQSNKVLDFYRSARKIPSLYFQPTL